MRALEKLGFDNVMMESDLPHMSSSYPNTARSATQALAPFAESLRSKLLADNAARLFSSETELDTVRTQLQPSPAPFVAAPGQSTR